PGADCLQRPLVPRSRFRQQLRPSVRLLLFQQTTRKTYCMDKETEHLQRLRALADRMKRPGEQSDLIVGEQIAEFGSLIVTLSETLVTLSHAAKETASINIRMQNRMTWITVIILLISVAQLVIMTLK